MLKGVIKIEEIWKDVVGYEGWYKVSNIGNVKRIKKIHCNHGKKNYVFREHILKPSKDRKGYLVVVVTDGVSKKHVKVHRLVAQSFIPNPDKKEQVDHINRCVSDNRAENLRWCTNKENQLNTKNNVILKYNGCSRTISEWSEETEIKSSTISARIRRGWTVEAALNVRPLEAGKKLLGGKKCRQN